MTPRYKWFALSSVFAVLVLLSAAPGGHAQPPAVKAGDDKKAEQKPLVRLQPAAALAEVIDMQEFQQPMSLRETLGMVYERMALRGIDFPIIMDEAALKGPNADDPAAYETQVKFPSFPAKMTAGTLLRIALSKIPYRKATFLFFPDHILITSFENASVEKRLQHPVVGAFENRKLGQVLRELSEQSGTSIVIDKRIGDKENSWVSAVFLNEITLAGALRVLTEMAELKVVVLEGTIFVTTPAHAKELREEKLLLNKMTNPLWPVLPPYPGASDASPRRTRVSVGYARGATVAVRPHSMVLTFPALCAATFGDPAQPPPAKAGDDKKVEKKPLLRLQPAAALAEVIDMKEFQQPMTLKEALGTLYQHMALRGIDFPIILDEEAFKEANPDAPAVYETQVKFPAFPNKIPVGNFLRLALGKIATGNATFVLYGDRIEVTTSERASAEVKLQYPVLATFENRKLSQVVHDLSELTGTTIILDKRIGAKEDHMVSAMFRNDVSLAGALRVVTETANLKVVVLEGTIFVTTPEHAKALRQEKQEMDEQFSPLWPILPTIPTGPFFPRNAKEAAR